MFFLDETLRVTRMAGSFADWIDRSSESLVGTKITALASEDDADALTTALTTVQSSQKSQTVTCEFDIYGQRTPIDIEFSYLSDAPELGEILGTVDPGTLPGSDLNSESRLVHLQNFIEILDEAAVVYEFVDSEPIVVAVNSTFEKTFGYTSQHIVDEPLNDYVVPAEHRDEATTIDDRIADGNVVQEVVPRRTTSGTQKFSFRGLPVEGRYGTQYGLATYVDVTEDQQAKQHVKVLHRVLRHNVRNELTVILGMAEKIRTDTDDSEIESAAQRIIERADDLDSVSEKARVAEDLLGQPPSDTIIELGSTTTDVIADARRQWPEATIESDIETPLPVSTGFELRDALENLVENAIVHNTESPTVRVTAQKETPIHLSTRDSGETVIVKIEDDGPGIPNPELNVVFEDADMTELRHGSGLGLWVVRWIVESADGTLSYDRSDGWTTITVRLPVADTDIEQTVSSTTTEDVS
jgi:PAS domain S-box-containing protein